MKKRIGVLAIFVCAVGIFVAGCGKQTVDYVRENMSEKTEVYYFGETTEFYGTLSSGQREKDYLMNGKSEEKVDFSLLTLNFYNETLGNAITVNLTVDEKTSEVELELNTLNSTYMVDLEKKFSGEEKIFVEYMEEKFELSNVSKDFVISADKAIEIASKELASSIKKEKKFSNLNAECYLRVLDKRANNFDSMFWCFTVINNKNESFSVVISTVDGSVLAKSN